MTSRKLSPITIAVTLASAIVVVGIVEIGALQAKERAENPPQYVNAENCVKCHSDVASLKKMRRKEGGTGVLFHKDGTLRK